MDKMVTEEDVETGYQNAYDLTYNTGGYGLKEYDNPESLWSGYLGESNNWDQLPYRIRDQHPAAGHIYHSFKAPIIPTKYYHKPIQHKQNTIDWQKISILALVKLGLAKLQAIGFLKILFFFGFKFVLYVKTIVFKFLLLMKKMKILKILALPLFVIKLFPSLMQLLSMTGQLFDISSIPALNIPAFQGLNTQQTSLSGGLLPSLPGTTSISGGNSVMGLTSGAIANRQAGANSSSLKFNDLKLINRQFYQPLESLDQALEIFQKVMDSEKCVERIACRIAAAKKAGVMPFWINWMLNSISKFLSNGKLESNFKTHIDVINEIYNKSTTPKNWASWCSEKYDCSINKK